MLPTAEHLAPHFPAYVPDLPGFGDSDKPAHALDVPRLLRRGSARPDLGAWRCSATPSAARPSRTWRRAVLFWMKFNTEVSAAALETYLDEVESYDEIHLMLFANGVPGIGLTPIECWRTLLGRAKQHGSFVGVDEKAYPADFAVFARYHPTLRQIPGRFPLPAPLSWSQLEEFVSQTAADRRTGVTIREGSGI